MSVAAELVYSSKETLICANFTKKLTYIHNKRAKE